MDPICRKMWCELLRSSNCRSTVRMKVQGHVLLPQLPLSRQPKALIEFCVALALEIGIVNLSIFASADEDMTNWNGNGVGGDSELRGPQEVWAEVSHRAAGGEGDSPNLNVQWANLQFYIEVQMLNEKVNAFPSHFSNTLLMLGEFWISVWVCLVLGQVPLSCGHQKRHHPARGPRQSSDWFLNHPWVPSLHLCNVSQKNCFKWSSSRWET